MNTYTFKVALLAMSAKPYHAGHHSLVTKAAAECDVVQVYTSLNTRGDVEKEEMPITKQASRTYWHRCVKPILPLNVEITFVDNPITAVYGDLADPMTDAQYFIYGGEEDVQSAFHNADKYTKLVMGETLFLKPISRNEVPISGTQVRKALFAGDFELFKTLVPPSLDASQAWSIFRSRADLQKTSTEENT